MFHQVNAIGDVNTAVPQQEIAAGSLSAVLQARAQWHPERTVYTFVNYPDAAPVSLSYGDLDREAKRLAIRLQLKGLTGERALLLYPPGLDFIVAFFACLYAGLVAVPAYPPSSNRHLARLRGILFDCRAAVILSRSEVADGVRRFAGTGGELLDKLWILTDVKEDVDLSAWHGLSQQGGDLAFLQYTSGSTGDAKGVMVSHGNLMANQALIKSRFGHNENSTVVGWLPLYHDMGLIGNVMQPLYCGSHAVLMAPMAFLEKPLRWLRAISDYRAHTSGGPNFAYDLCEQKITESDLEGLDLTNWRLAFNGAEPVAADTLEKFANKFSVCGFRRSSFYPCYGLAEATLLATGSAKREAPRISAFGKADLQRRLAVSASDGSHETQRLVSCGCADRADGVRIVDPDSGEVCADGRIGEIWLTGASIAQGYWQKPEASERTFVVDSSGRRWLRSGDLGFIDGGDLFVSGRLKDLIIVRGRNFYPHDLERAVAAACDALNPGGVVAIAIDEGEGERLILLAELRRNRLRQPSYQAEFLEIRACLTEECGVQAERIVFLKPGAILKTSSGKLRRDACRETYMRQAFDVLASDGVSITAQANAEPVSADDPERRLVRLALAALPDTEAVALLAGHLVRKTAELAGVAVETIGADRALTGLGLDSLKAVELKYFIDELMGVDLPIGGLLGDVSLHDAAGAALALLKQGGNATVLPAAVASPMAMSYNQQALWTKASIHNDDGLYRMPIALQLRGHLDCAALSLALADLHARHEQLRCGFGLDAELRPIRIPLEQNQPRWELSECADSEQQQANLRAFISRPFDMRHGPLLRVGVFSCGANDHLLAFCAHHLVVDFRSLQVLLTELGQMYRAHAGGSAARLPGLAANYADFVAWQQGYLSSPFAERDAEFWREQLTDELPRLTLPGELPQSAVTSYRAGSEILKIDPEMLSQLKQLAASNRVTLCVLLLSVFKTLLYRYSHQSDLIVGTPALGRPQRAYAATVGYFVNPLTLRTQPRGRQRFSEFLAVVNALVAEASSRQNYPCGLLNEDRRLSPVNPPFRVWFALQDGTDPLAAALALGLHGVAGEWGGFSAVTAPLEAGSEEFDLALLCAETGCGLTATLRYRCDVLESSAVQRMRGHLQCLLRGVLANPSVRLSELPLLTDIERQSVRAWNDTRTEYAESPTTMVGVFEAVADSRPDSVALVFGERRFSYAELNRIANRLAHYLIAQGVGPEQRVALSTPRGPELLIGLLAILKAGAVYVPVDPNYPAERQCYLFEDAGVARLLTVSALVTELACGELAAICVDQVQLYSAYGAENPRVKILPETAAYLIYTSGSTGQPKGVMVSHANLLHSTRARQAYYREPIGCYLLLPSFAFDSSVAGIFWTLSQGGCLCLPGDGLLKEPLGLGALIETHSVTHVLTLPSLYQLLLEHVPSAALASLRTAIVAGEACPGALAALHHTRLPSVAMYNEYGPTEATVWCSVRRINRSDELTAVLPIGLPIANTRIHIVDADLNPVPIGVAGELLVGGGGVARGYLNRPDLTAERFVPDRFAGDGGRLYRTGDRVRYRDDGVVEFLGRFDLQVKIRGFRIELGEIEAALLSHPGLDSVAVTVREDVPGKKRLVAYWVGGAEEEAIRAHLGTRLPEYMQPSAWVRLTSMPLNANGKLDRKLLPMPEIKHDDAFIAPRDEAEEAVAAIWREVLGVERLGVHDDFFELGGHSLAGVQVVAKIQEVFAIELPVNVLFEAPTLAGFVDRLAAFQDAT